MLRVQTPPRLGPWPRSPFPFIAIAHRPPNPPSHPTTLVALTQPKHFIKTGPIVVEMGHRENYLKDSLI